MATAAINRRRWSDNNLGDLTDAGPRFIAGRLEMENSFILSKEKKKKKEIHILQIEAACFPHLFV